MHDPLVVAHEVPSLLPRRKRWQEKGDSKKWGRWGLCRRRRTNAENLGQPVHPWWRPAGWRLRLAGRSYGLGTVATIWHVEPGGRDSGKVCGHYLRGERWQAMPRWKVRLNPFIKPFDDGKWAVDRSWKWHVWHWRIQVHALQGWRARLFDRCTECGRKGNPNISHQWDGGQIGWRKWRSRPGLYHMECSSLVSLRQDKARDEELIRALFAALRVERDETEQETLSWLTDAGAPGLEFLLQRRLWTLFGYERDDNYRLVPSSRPSSAGSAPESGATP